MSEAKQEWTSTTTMMMMMIARRALREGLRDEDDDDDDYYDDVFCFFPVRGEATVDINNDDYCAVHARV